MKHLLTILLISSTSLFADEAAALAKLRASVRSEDSLQVNRDKATGKIKEIRLNGPALQNEDLALFNQFIKLERITISHAGYGFGKKTGVDFSGVEVLKDHPSLQYFSAGGAVGKPYLEALSKLTNIQELYIQTTSSLDQDWAAIGTMKHLTYLGIRVRNDRMSKLTGNMFEHLLPLENLEHFLLSEMTFKDDWEPFMKFILSRHNLKQLSFRRSNLPEEQLAKIRKAKPNLEIIIKD